MFLDIIVYITGALGICFCILCLACGLFYLAELIEEYTKTTKKILSGVIIVTKQPLSNLDSNHCVYSFMVV
jgi:hypothetical protein